MLIAVFDDQARHKPTVRFESPTINNCCKFALFYIKSSEIMRTIGMTGQKWLKTVHLLAAILWIGCGIAMNLLRVTIMPDTPEGMVVLSLSIKILDDLLIFGGVIGILVTAIVYGVWTRWGFFKQRWLTVKWIMTVVMILIGWIIMGPAVSGNVQSPEWYATNMAVYNSNLGISAVWGPIQLLLLGGVLVISVFKPWKAKKKVQ